MKEFESIFKKAESIHNENKEIQAQIDAKNKY